MMLVCPGMEVVDFVLLVDPGVEGMVPVSLVELGQTAKESWGKSNSAHWRLC